MLPDLVNSHLLDQPINFEEGEIDEEISRSEGGDVASEGSREVVKPFPPPPEPGISSLECPMAFIDRDEVGSVSAEVLEADLVRNFSTSMVRVDLAVKELTLDSGEASNHQELVIFSDTPLDPQFQASPLRKLDVTECGEEPISPLICEPLAIIEPSTQDGANMGFIPVKKKARSKWVNSHYQDFCKLVGFPIDTHEEQCLELLRKQGI